MRTTLLHELDDVPPPLMAAGFELFAMEPPGHLLEHIRVIVEACERYRSARQFMVRQGLCVLLEERDGVWTARMLDKVTDVVITGIEAHGVDADAAYEAFEEALDAKIRRVDGCLDTCVLH